VATVVFFHAHPDDEALATAGTMIKMSAAGHRVLLVLATRGEEGEPVPGVLSDGEELGERRSQEVQAAADLLGVARVAFLNYRDSGMIGSSSSENPACFWQADESEAVGRLVALLADEAVDLLVAYDPHGGYGHPDHIQVHRVGTRWAAEHGVRLRWVTMNRDIVRSVVAEAMGEVSEVGQEPDADLAKRSERLTDDLFGLPDAEITHGIVVTEVLERKRAAIAAHASQVAPDSFFLAPLDARYEAAFGTEWFVDPGRPRIAGEPHRTDLLLN